MKSPSLHIHIFSDGRPGHEIQSLSLGKALLKLARAQGIPENQTSLNTCRFAIRQPWLSFAPRILPRFGRHILWQHTPPAATTPADLIITCGRRAAAVGKWFKRTRHKAGDSPCHVQILNPGDSPSHYDYLLLPRHDLTRNLSHARHVIPFSGSLHPVDADWLANKKRQWAKQFAALRAGKQPVVGVLLGNPGQKFFAQHLAKTREQINQWQPGAQLAVVASPRTPEKAKKAIAAVFSDAALMWLNDTDGDNPYAGVLACCDALAVTADSINMLSEASATGKPVLPLAIELASPKHRQLARALDLQQKELRKIKNNSTLDTAVALWEAIHVAD